MTRQRITLVLCLLLFVACGEEAEDTIAPEESGGANGTEKKSDSGLVLTYNRTPTPVRLDPSKASTPQLMFDVLRKAAQEEDFATIRQLLDTYKRAELANTGLILDSLEESYDTGKISKDEYLRVKEKIQNPPALREYLKFADYEAGEASYDENPSQCTLKVKKVQKPGAEAPEDPPLLLLLVREGGMWRLDVTRQLQLNRPAAPN